MIRSNPKFFVSWNRTNDHLAMHPLYILLIVAGGLAVVGVAVAIIIKMVQSSRKKKTVTQQIYFNYSGDFKYSD